MGLNRPPSHSASVAAIGCAVLVLGLATPVGAGGDGAAVALLPPIAQARVPASELAAVTRALRQLAETYTGARIVDAESVRRKLGDPAAATRSCNDDVRCLTRLGRKAGAGIIVVARIAAPAGGTRVRLFALEVSSRRLVGVASWSLRQGDATAAALRPHIDAVLGVPPTALTPELEIPALAPVPVLATSSGKGPADVPGSGARDDPAAGGEVLAAAPVMAGATAPADAGPLTPLPTDEGPMRPMRYAAYGGLGVGAVLLALSGYYGLRYRSARDSIDVDGPRTTSLPEVLRLERDANSARGRAGWLLLSGGIAAVAGGALVLVDLNLEAAATARVALSVHGSQVRLQAAW